MKDRSYRFAFVAERVRSSIALQVRALREQRNRMTQKQLGDTLGMAQTWVSKLESPDYGKMSVATLLRLAEAFDTDLEIKFRPFSVAVEVLPSQGPEYFAVPSFDEERVEIEAKLAREEEVMGGSFFAGRFSIVGSVAMASPALVHPARKKVKRPTLARRAVSEMPLPEFNSLYGLRPAA